MSGKRDDERRVAVIGTNTMRFPSRWRDLDGHSLRGLLHLVADRFISLAEVERVMGWPEITASPSSGSVVGGQP